MSKFGVTLGALTAALGLMGAACGSSGPSTAQASSTSSAQQSTTTAANGSTTTGPGAIAPATRPTSVDEWEKLWATQRAAIVKKITDNKWGKSADGKTLTGPADFKIDLSKCAPGWSDTEGITDDTIKIGHTTPLSGAAADYGNIGRAIQVISDYYSEKGTFKDVNGKTRKINFIMKDDGYDAARTIPLVDELIDSEKVFAVWTLGAPPGLKVYNKLNQRCIPHPLEMSGHPAWGDPVNHPWTTGQQMAYSTEAVLWGAFIEKHLSEFGGKVKVAALVANSDFGKSYDSAFKAYIQQSANKDKFDYFNEVVEFSAPTVTDPMTTLAAKNPDVFITMTGGAQCPQIILEAAQNGMKQKAKYMFTSSTCKAASFVGKAKLGGDGSASNGWWIVGGGAIDFNAAAYDNDAYVKWGRELLSAKGYDYKTSGSFGSGFLFAFPFMQALQIADQLPGGLTRSNFILALRTFDMTNPMLLQGIKYNMNGNADAYLTEGSDISQYDSAKQQWVQQGDVVELSGKSRNCAFDESASICK